VLDTETIQGIDKDHLGEDTITIAGGLVQSVNLYLSDIFVNALKVIEVEILEMKEEYLMGIALMRSVCERVIFGFENEEVLFES
jgi:hypothetical protein